MVGETTPGCFEKTDFDVLFSLFFLLMQEQHRPEVQSSASTSRPEAGELRHGCQVYLGPGVLMLRGVSCK